MSPATSLKHLRKIVLSHLWNQWSSLGLSGYGKADHRIIDPEALLLFSLEQTRFDARLFDEIFDWCFLNAALLSVPRLKAINGRFPDKTGKILSILAAMLHDLRGGAKWKMLLDTVQASSSPEPLFMNTEGQVIPVIQKPDPRFLKHGLLRNALVLRGNSTAFPSNEAAAMLLTLRSLMGGSARCEILAHLSSGQEKSPSQIARQTGYSQKNVQDALVQMIQSGYLAVRCAGREKRYRLEDELRHCLTKGKIAVPFPWMALYPLVSKVMTLLAKAAAAGVEESSLTPMIQQFFKDSEALLIEGGVEPGSLSVQTTGAGISSLEALLVRKMG